MVGSALAVRGTGGRWSERDGDGLSALVVVLVVTLVVLLLGFVMRVRGVGGEGLGCLVEGEGLGLHC